MQNSYFRNWRSDHEVQAIGSTGGCEVINRNIFEDLFVLDMSTSYLDTLERGLRIIHDFSHVVRFNNVRSAIKLPFRDVGNSVQTDYGNAELDCLKETTQVALADADYL
jgi:hypothetical protein